MLISCRSRILLRLSPFFCIVVALFSVAAAEIEPSSPESLSLADLQRLFTEHGRVIRSFRLEGVVCAVVPKGGMVVLQDESATVLLELPTVDSEVRAGDRLVIEGKDCPLIKGALAIQIASALVDNDGHHPSAVKSGRVALQAGFEPLRLAWFNSGFDAVLKLEWEGPGIRRHRVPNAALWRLPSGLTNLSGLDHGLNYTACNGDGLLSADFENRKPAGQGVATNFDVSYRVRPEHTALFFSGYVQIPRAGIYTFYLTSDDGAQLKIGVPPVSCTRVSPDAPSVPRLQTLSQTRLKPGTSSWVELEGEVTFAGINLDHLSLDLVVDGNRVPVTVVGGATLFSTNLLHDHIRVRGMCEVSQEGRITRIVVPSSKQVKILGSESEYANVSPLNLVLTSVSQVQHLTPEQVAQKIPARIRGVLIGTRDIALMLQDSTGGISVRFRARDWADQPHVGEMLEVEGVTGPGFFAPVIMAQKVRCLGQGPMPEPIRPRWNQLMNGSLDCVYVEMEGVLIAASGRDLTLLSADGTVTVEVDGGGVDNFYSLLPSFVSDGAAALGSLVRLRGCCMPDTDQLARHVIRGRIHLNTPLMTIEEIAPSNPFSLPTRKIAELLWFDARASALQRTKLKGQVLHAEAGEYLVLEEQLGFRIRTSRPVDLHAGDLVEAVGFPKMDGPSPMLQEAQIQRVGQAPLPVPVPLSAGNLLEGNHDATLIQVEATLLGESAHSQGRTLELQAGSCHFLAVQKSALNSAMSLAVGSRLQILGVYASAGENRVKTSTDPFVVLLIDEAGAIKVLERPSWWTAKHALIFAGVLAGSLGLALVWITLLRKKVELRTAQLRNEIQERQRAEQDQAIEQERTRMAQDLHDELGAGLTTVGLLGALVKNPATPPEKKDGYLEQIAHSAHSLVTALDEIVWAVNPKHDSIISSANYYAYFAQPFLNAAGIACRLEIAESFSENPLGSQLRHGVFLAFKEALNNVVRHSGATEVIIKIRTVDKQLLIDISDNGRGIVGGASADGTSHDGMAGMRDRLASFGGNCQIVSRAGLGTTVEFRIPFPASRFDNDADAAAKALIDPQEDKL